MKLSLIFEAIPNPHGLVKYLYISSSIIAILK